MWDSYNDINGDDDDDDNDDEECDNANDNDITGILLNLTETELNLLRRVLVLQLAWSLCNQTEPA